MEIEQGEDLADLRALAAPGRQDRRGEPFTLAGGHIDPLVVHARRFDLDRSGARGDVPRLVVAVAHDQAAALVVPLALQLGYIGVDFGLQSGGQHPPRALADNLVDQGAVTSGSVGV